MGNEKKESSLIKKIFEKTKKKSKKLLILGATIPLFFGMSYLSNIDNSKLFSKERITIEPNKKTYIVKNMENYQQGDHFGGYDGPKNINKENYWGKEGDFIEFQFSMTGPILLYYPTSLNLGYTYRGLWYKWDSSGPVKNIYNPEIFFLYKPNTKKDYKKFQTYLDFIKLGLWEHQSNGEVDRGNIRGRSMGYDRRYVEFGLSMGERIVLGFNSKISQYIILSSKEEKKDLEEYLGPYESELFLKINDFNIFNQIKSSIRLAPGGKKHGLDFERGWKEYSAEFGFNNKYFIPNLLIIYREGCAREAMHNYRIKIKRTLFGLSWDW